MSDEPVSVSFTVNGAPRCLATHICGWDPVGDRTSWQANRKQSGTEAFYMVNKFHDHLAGAPIGFDKRGEAVEIAEQMRQGRR